MFVGTLTNVVTVLLGTAIGAIVGARLPERIQQTIVGALGLLVLGLGFREVVMVESMVIVLAAVLLGAITGEVLRIEQGFERLGSALQSRLVRGDDASDDRFARGFVLATLLFCIGPLTILGAIADGLGDPELLLLKAGLDGFAAVAFAAVYGWGVGLSALVVLLLQGGIALLASSLDGLMTPAMVEALGATGGVLLLGVALRLLDVKQIRVANLLPALLFAPLLVAVAGSAS